MQSALADAPKSHAVPWRTHKQLIYKQYNIKFTARSRELFLGLIHQFEGMEH